MLEAYLPRPAELHDLVEPQLKKLVRGLIGSVSQKQRLCYITAKTVRYSASANKWQDVRIDETTGYLELVPKPTQFDERRGGFMVSLPASLTCQEIYMQVDGTKHPVLWFLVSDYEQARERLIVELAKKRQEYDATTLYSAAITNRTHGPAVCDPVHKRFVPSVVESTEVIFKGNDVAVLKRLVASLWPSTWAKEITIRDLGPHGNENHLCTCLPWSSDVPLRRTDQLLSV